MAKVAIAKSRALGTTEINWCKALDGGTGITVTGILFEQYLSVLTVQAAVSDVLASQPLLRAEVQDRNGTFWFDIKDDIVLEIDVIDRRADENNCPSEEADKDQELWLQIFEDEMNTLYPAQKPHPALQVRLYCLPDEASLLILRMHPAATDMPSGPPVCSALLSSIRYYTVVENSGENLQELLEKRKGVSDFPEKDVISMELPSLEDAIPPGQANKPFWAHGIDVVGYGLVSRRHAYLPFETPGKPSRSRIIRSILSVADTEKCLEACKAKKTDLYGILAAAALKAVTGFKKVGAKGEHYGVVIMMDCRKLLQPRIAETTVGFYNAAIMRTTHVTETVNLWELAGRCTKDLNDSVKNRKHFTDMGDLNMLMVQAINHPGLTPSGSMRTALVSVLSEPVIETMGEDASALKVKDAVTGCSTHGVGTCLAVFPFLRNGSLRISYIYCTPLFSSSTMQTLVDSIHANLTNLE